MSGKFIRIGNAIVNMGYVIAIAYEETIVTVHYTNGTSINITCATVEEAKTAVITNIG